MMNKASMFIYLCACIAFSFCARTLTNTPQTTLTYLALGDSYTIGEGVPSADNYPHQTTTLLKKSSIEVSAPTIIAKTGWTTDELQLAIDREKPDTHFDIVSLLIGVNNQYRGRSIDEYSGQFEQLLKQAITFANNKPDHVFVLSIPDWGATPFAEGSDRTKIAAEIDAFNAVNCNIAAKYAVHYLDITPGTREAATDATLVTTDQLHPSAKEYARWSVRLAVSIDSVLHK